MHKNIFIVGNSRSGTTMLMRIFDRYPNLKIINETHFLERFWSRDDDEKYIDKETALDIVLKLISRQRDGLFTKSNNDYLKESAQLVVNLDKEKISRLELYKSFLKHEMEVNNNVICCEKTPQYVFYISELLEHFPDALIINMVRDPRAVLVSQKSKWERRSMRNSFMSVWESIFLQINYHPTTMSHLWNASVGAAYKFKNNKRLKTVRYEDLLNKPEDIIEDICAFCDLNYSPDLLNIPNTSSSIKKNDQNKKGIVSRADNYWKYYLSPYEIHIVQEKCTTLMEEYGYSRIKTRTDYWRLTLVKAIYPLKIILAFIVSIKRLKGLRSAIQRRLNFG